MVDLPEGYSREALDFLLDAIHPDALRVVDIQDTVENPEDRSESDGTGKTGLDAVRGLSAFQALPPDTGRKTPESVG